MKNIVIFGAPGSGKGTQSDKIIAEFGVAHISTGDVLRSEIKANTDLGNIASKLDGFPRTIAQAQALDEMLAERGEKVNYVIGLEVDDAELINRIVERGKTSGRSDDNVETAKKRLETYYAQTLPLKEFYVSQGKYVKINGVGSIDEIYSEIRNTLK